MTTPTRHRFAGLASVLALTLLVGLGPAPSSTDQPAPTPTSTAELAIEELVHTAPTVPTVGALASARARSTCSPTCAAYVAAVLTHQARQLAAVRTFLAAALELHRQPFLVCVRAHESDTAGGYRATDGGRGGRENMGAYQFDQPTWNSAAGEAGLPHLVGRRPDTVAGFDQDRVAWAWYQRAGWRPWAGSGCY